MSQITKEQKEGESGGGLDDKQAEVESLLSLRDQVGKVTSLNAPTHLEPFLQRSECQTKAEECLRAYFLDGKRLKSAKWMLSSARVRGNNEMSHLLLDR